MNADPLTRLAGANPVVGDMPPLDLDIEQLKHQRSSHAGVRSEPGHLRHLHGLIIAVPTLAAACAAALLLVLLPTDHPNRTQAPPLTAPTSQSDDISQVLAVFSAPQAGYRAACHGARQLDVCTLRVEGSQVRSVALGGGYTAVIDPVDVARTTHLAHRGQAIVLGLHGPQRGPMNMTTPATLKTVRHQGLLVSAFTRLGTNRGAILVPNGVADVTLTHLDVHGTSAAADSAVKVSTTKVSHNISILRISGVTSRALNPRVAALKRYYISSVAQGCHTTQAVYALPATAEMSWRNSSGTRIHHTTISLRVKVGITNPPQNTAPLPRHCG
jgi:hypothetical protein